MLGWLKKLVGDSAPSPRAARFSPLRPLEMLESRENPADITWLGGNGDFNTAANWSTNTVPVAADTIIADGAQSNADLPFPAVPGKTFEAILIKGTYAGHVIFPMDITFDKYYQGGGHVLLFGGSTRTLTVTSPNVAIPSSEFMWTGGDIVGSGKYVLQGVKTASSTIGMDGIVLNSDANFVVDCQAVGSGITPISSDLYQRG